MSKARDIADGTRYVDVTGDTMVGALNLLTPGFSGGLVSTATTGDTASRWRISRNTSTGQSGKDWFLSVNTDTGAFAVHESGVQDQLIVSPGGRVTMPGQPAFHAVGGGGFTPSQGQVLPFTTAITNRGSHYNISTQRFTAPVGGVYLLTTRATWGGSGTGSVPFIAINGTAVGGAAAYTEIFGYNTVNGYHTTSAVAAPVSMNAGDYADVRVTIYNSSVSSFDLTRSSFGGYLIG